MMKNGPCKGPLQSGKIKTWVFEGLLQKMCENRKAMNWRKVGEKEEGKAARELHLVAGTC
jgi:hypothetical protein